MNFLAFVGLLNFLTAAVSAWIVLRARPRSQAVLAYGLFSLSVACWSISFFIWQLMRTAETALPVLRWVLFFGIWPNQTFLYFVFAYDGITPRRKTVLWATFAINIISTVLIFNGVLFPSVEERMGLGYWGNVTPWFTAYMIFWHLECFYGFKELIQMFRTAVGRRREQIQYFLVAMVIGYLGGYSSWPLWYKIYVPPQLNILVSCCVGFLAYAIIRHHLLDINVVIRKTLLYSFATAGLTSAYAGAVTLLARFLENPSALTTLSPVVVFTWFAKDPKVSYAYSCVLTAVFSACFGLFVWSRAWRRPMNKFWGLSCLFIAAWSLGEGLHVRAATIESSYFWAREEHMGACFIVAFFLHFVSVLVQANIRRVLAAVYAMGASLAVLFWFTRMVEVRPMGFFNYYGYPVNHYWMFTVYFFAVVFYAHYLLFKKWRTAEGQYRNQLLCVFSGTAIGFIGGATTFFFAWGYISFPYGVYAIPVYIVMVSYAIFKHQLMDINVVIRKTLLYSLVSAALAGVYVGTITLIAHVLEGRHGPASAVSSALAAIFITLLFNPVRIRTQHWIDRHFPREKLDPDLLQEAAGGFAHEMKRPLSKISLPAEMALLDLERVKSGEMAWKDVLPKVEERLRFIMSQPIDAGYMIEAIRDLSASSSAPLTPVGLRAAAEIALGAEMGLLEKRDISVHLQIPENLPPVAGRARQLEIVFVNLIKNAAEAMSDLAESRPREIWIEARAEGDWILIRVKDSGPGIKQENQGKIFQPHYTTKGSNGTGMGLYLTSQIIHAHGGTIDISSRNGHGTEFTIRLPLKS